MTPAWIPCNILECVWYINRHRKWNSAYATFSLVTRTRTGYFSRTFCLLAQSVPEKNVPPPRWRFSSIFLWPLELLINPKFSKQPTFVFRDPLNLSNAQIAIHIQTVSYQITYQFNAQTWNYVTLYMKNVGPYSKTHLQLHLFRWHCIRLDIFRGLRECQYCGWKSIRLNGLIAI